MRQYRGLTKDGKWVYGWYVEIGQDSYIVLQDAGLNQYDDSGEYCILEHHFVEVIPETVGQFTGLKDKNGKKVYKAIIVKAQHKTTKEEIVGVVVWDKTIFGWGLKLDDWTMGFQCLVDCYVFEIIGNIHENSEPMKEKETNSSA